MRRMMESKLQIKKHQLAIMIERLKGISPLEKLSQGYAFLEQNIDGRSVAVKSIKQVQEGEQLSVYVADGRIQAVVTGIREERYE